MSVRYALLGLLAQQPRYGYELCAAFTALAGGRENWAVAPAQIYTTLNRMCESGLIERESSHSNDKTQKQFFLIKPSGIDELKNWFQSSVQEEPQQDAFYLKLMLSLDLDWVDASSLIHIQRASLYQDLHRVTTLRQTLDPTVELARVMLMDKAIMHLEADLRWLDMIEARLEEMLHQPIPPPELRSRGRPKSATI
jgi:DNA-binding PadR family transcriptional regulator